MNITAKLRFKTYVVAWLETLINSIMKTDGAKLGTQDLMPNSQVVPIYRMIINLTIHEAPSFNRWALISFYRTIRRLQLFEGI